jgi:sulfur relay protein TusB/DsrH
MMNRFDLDSLQLAEKMKEERSEVDVILIQDAVYMALKSSDQSEKIKNIMDKGVKLHILRGDVERRGTIDHLLANVELIDYDRLIDLLFKDDQTVINI